MRIASTPRSLFTPPPKADGAASSRDAQQVDAPEVESGPEAHAVHTTKTEFDATAHAEHSHRQALFAGITEATGLMLDPLKSSRGGMFDQIAKHRGYDPDSMTREQRQNISYQLSFEFGKSAGADGPSFVDIVNGKGALETALHKVLGAPR